MSRLFGAIRQNGYVVRDLEAAMRHWTTVLHVGPFFHLPHVAMDELVYRGAPSAADVSIALAFSGELQIELIQQHNDAPSLYRDFLAAGREGLQHVSSWTADFEGTLARVTAAGHRVAQHGTLMGGGVRFAYFDTELHPGTVFEVSNLTAEPFKGMLDAMIEAARTWDGREPIRRL
jgi:catechol 2,3-dioxygenase-like lactoylglutathione lyase family enzyme